MVRLVWVMVRIYLRSTGPGNKIWVFNILKIYGYISQMIFPYMTHARASYQRKYYLSDEDIQENNIWVDRPWGFTMA
jgi:hypothetical protein